MASRTGLLFGTALAAGLGLGSAALPLLAQTAAPPTAEGEGGAGADTGPGPETGAAGDAATGTGSAAAAPSAGGRGDDSPSAGEAGDAVVATVGGVEIRSSDVMGVMGMLPPQLQAQPPQMLFPIALDQLILRELILQEARAQGLDSDPEVIALREATAAAAEEDALVQVWLSRELSGAVTDDAVQEAYDAAQDQGRAQGQPALPPLSQVRGQVEQALRQQEMRDLQIRLREGADIVLFDPAGRPVDRPRPVEPDGGTGAGAGPPATGNGAGSGAGASDGGSSDGGSGEDSAPDAGGEGAAPPDPARRGTGGGD